MKHLFFFVCLLLSLNLNAQDKPKRTYYYEINGHLYEAELSEYSKTLNCRTVIMPVGKAIVYSLKVAEDFVLPERLQKYEITPETDPAAAETLDKALTITTMSRLTAKKMDEGKSLKVGMQLDRFSLKDFNGDVWDNARIGGKVTVFNVWYSGCGPCLQEMPEISAWKDEFPQVNFLSVNFENQEKMQRIVERRGFTWTHLPNDRYFTSWVANDQDGGYPLNIVVDADGYVRYVVHGTNEEKRAKIIDAIKSCLSEMK